jgi:BlaI family transcriptional regulator, penicillinase repressor
MQPKYLSKREQQIMELIYKRGEATASEVTDELPGNATNSTVRSLLRILEERGRLTHTVTDGKFVYRAVQEGASEGRNALGKVVETFFKGSVSQTVAALLDENERLTANEFEELERLIAKAKQEGR